ncbi:MAG: DUF4410 domain-containing protein [Candidatus Acidiferrum sp.]|jgi:hypothetical protein
MKFLPLLTIMAVAAALPSEASPPAAEKRAAAFSQAPSGDAFPNKSLVVYVSDFDIGATDAPGTVRPASRRALAANAQAAGGTAGAAGAAPASGSSGTPGAPAVSSATTANAPAAADPAAADGEDSLTPRADGQAADSQKAETPKSDGPPEDSPRVQAAKLVELTSTTLVKVLQQAGYTVKRLRNSAARPENGVVIHGVFAQADPSAGLRRVMFGGTATDPKMLLFVGVGNLSKPEQALYQVVGPLPVGTLGPAISVSAYAPVSRYELDRDPSEEQLTRTAEKIATDLTRVLNANPLALGQ